MTCSPADVGHAGVSRDRTYVIMRHVETVDCLHDPMDLYHQIASHISHRIATQPQEYMIATHQEIALEASAVARQRGIIYQPEETDLQYLLNHRERRVLQFACLEYFSRFGKSPQSDPNLAVFLGDNPEWSVTWSAISQRIPSFRLNTGKMYFPYFHRWMCHSEKLAAFGFPVHDDLSSEMGRPSLPIKDERRAASLAGNCMCLPVVTVVTLVALASMAEKRLVGSEY